MPFNETNDGKTYFCEHQPNGICNKCLGNDADPESKPFELQEYNQAQLYILINALENLNIPAYETEYEFIRNNLLSRFMEQLKEYKAKYDKTRTRKTS